MGSAARTFPIRQHGPPWSVWGSRPGFPDKSRGMEGTHPPNGCNFLTQAGDSHGRAKDPSISVDGNTWSALPTASCHFSNRAFRTHDRSHGNELDQKAKTGQAPLAGTRVRQALFSGPCRSPGSREDSLTFQTFRVRITSSTRCFSTAWIFPSWTA